MAETKKTTAKKGKATKPKVVKTENKENTPVQVENIKESLDEVATSINLDETEIQEPDTTVLEDVVGKINEIEEAQNNLNKVLNENPEQGEQLITKELEKALTLKEEVKKIIKTNKTTSTWNGMYVDY